MATPAVRRPKSWLGQLSTIANVSIVCCALILALLVLLVGRAAISAGRYVVGPQVHVPVDVVDGLRADPGALAPGVDFYDDVSLHLTHATTGQMALSMLPLVVALLFLLAGALILRRALSSAMREGPFTLAVATRLRRLGQLAVIGAMVHALVETVVDAVLISDALPDDHEGIVWTFDFPAPLILAGFGMFSVSEIVRHGVHLREEVEGTI